MKNEILRELSIFIPTFNRNKKLVQTVKDILEIEGNEQISIVVIDNASDKPVQTSLNEENIYSENLKVIENSINIGICGNIIECFRQCNTQWLWVLGDDDKVSANALDNIINQLEHLNETETLCVNFKTEMADKRTLFSVVSEVSELNNIETPYSNLLFISTNIYNARILKAYMAEGIMFSYPLQPHTAMLFQALLKKEGKIAFSADSIVNWHNDLGSISWSIIHMTVSRDLILNLPAISNNRDYLYLKKYVMLGYDNYNIYLNLIRSFLEGKIFYERTLYYLKAVRGNGSNAVISTCLYFIIRFAMYSKSLLRIMDTVLSYSKIAIENFRK